MLKGLHREEDQKVGISFNQEVDNSIGLVTTPVLCVDTTALPLNPQHLGGCSDHESTELMDVLLHLSTSGQSHLGRSNYHSDDNLVDTPNDQPHKQQSWAQKARNTRADNESFMSSNTIQHIKQIRGLTISIPKTNLDKLHGQNVSSPYVLLVVTSP
eukprot:TRINITY_DN25301_c0_g1_i2.p1 TRINITY_DN25301_c0_g1~~TRINITY_DN25301_c0_g1_i2.p1  ORF type:complete len:157 (+),score=13.32 TRINITY_DN25301_c0_g1_i2:1132-1602(+)